jgi:predicted MPP superfamily phosphohydrolase
VAVLIGDVIVVLLLLALDAVLDPLNHGSHARRVVVIGVHLSLAAAIPWAVWSTALSRAAGRRMILAGSLVGAFTVPGLILPGLWLSSTPAPAEVTYFSVPVKGLPPTLNGVRIIVIGDTHLGDRVTVPHTRARLRPLRELDGDIVIFLGDLAGGSRSLIAPGAALLDQFCPKTRRFFVVGNHEQWVDEDLALKEMRQHGFAPLIDANQRLHLRGADLWVAGVEFTYTWRNHLPCALRGVPDGAPLVLFSHTPDVVSDPLSQRADLVISGHTHGGQIVLPFLGPLACSSIYGPKYASGLFAVGRSRLFVTRGIGDWPFRLYCPPEIAVLELHPA